jgi:uncharacterized membrane protein YphA (DoxX/SURF4 family)
MFPTGSAGIALLVLRCVVAVKALIDANRCWAFGSAPALDALKVLLALCLFLGLLTPYCAAVASLLEVGLLVSTGFSTGYAFGLCALTAACAAVLGPGAYSLDARLFGRKLITIQPGRDK